MTEVPVTPAPRPAPHPTPWADDRQTALIVYVLMLVPIVPVISHIVGLVMAYVSRDTAPPWLRSHYNFQINTFWMGLLYFVVAGLLCLLLVGFLLLPVVAIWWIVRCALGLSRLMRSEPYPTPDNWLI